MKNLLALIIPLGNLIAACSKEDSSSTGRSAASDPSRIAITVSEKGFEPDPIKVAAGRPVTLVFTRNTDQTCAKEIVVTLDGGKKIDRPLPLNTPVELVATFPKAGTLSYACGMDMMKGTIVVE